MKRILWIIVITFVMVPVGGCANKKNNQVQDTPSNTPLPTESMAQEDLDEAEDMTEDSSKDQTVDPNIDQTEDTLGNDTGDKAYNIEDLFPYLSNTEYIYEGVGNEYAAFCWSVDYYDQDKSRIQTRTNHGGTELVKVIELKDGIASIIYQREEAYYRENLLEAKKMGKQAEVLLMEPIQKGTEWTLKDGRKRYISDINVELKTPIETYQTVEVITESENGTIKDYYAPGVGLVKSLFQYEDTQVSSTLSEIHKNQPLVQLVEIYYPQQKGKLYVEHKSIAFPTNTMTRIILQEAMQEPSENSKYQPLISNNTMINSLFLGEDGIVYVDFTKDLIEDMNGGSKYEKLILQGIANTLGNYYGSDKVYLTVEGKPYKSGNLSYKKGKTIRVEMGDVAK